MIEMSKYDYEEMSKFFNNIIVYMMEQIDNQYPAKINHTNGEVAVQQPYMDAYDHFEPVIYGLSDNFFMKDYYEEPHFEYYAIDNINDARNAIESYLSKGDVDFSTDDVVQNYKYYDDIITQCNIEKQYESEEDIVVWINNFKEKHDCDYELNNVNRNIAGFKQSINQLEQFLDNSKYITNVEDIKSTIEEINTLFSKIVIDTKDI